MRCNGMFLSAIKDIWRVAQSCSKAILANYNVKCKKFMASACSLFFKSVGIFQWLK